MADVNFFDHFEMPWAQNGEVEAIQDNQYKQGWAYIGAVPPSVEQFNKVQQLSDEKTAWLFAQVKKLAEQGGYALTATMVDALTTGIAASMQAGVGVIGTDTGAANAYVVNFAPAITQLKDGMALWFKVKTANTGASTLNVNGLGARAIVGPAHTALQGGELVANGKALVVWRADANSWALAVSTGEAQQVPVATKSGHAIQLGQFTGANQSIGTTGFQKLPGGMILQYGSVTSGGATSGTITFPVAFPTACRIVVAHDYGAGANDVSNVRIAPPTQTGASWVGQTFQAQPSDPGTWAWLALGN